jgi:hypothetical protein
MAKYKLATTDDQFKNAITYWGSVASNPNNTNVKLNGVPLLVDGATYTWPGIFVSQPINDNCSGVRINGYNLIVEDATITGYPLIWLEPLDRKITVDF